MNKISVPTFRCKTPEFTPDSIHKYWDCRQVLKDIQNAINNDREETYNGQPFRRAPLILLSWVRMVARPGERVRRIAST